MNALIVIPLHDREELVRPCLDALVRAGEDFHLAVVADAPNFDPTPYRAVADFYAERPDVVGPAAARNIGLSFRERGQDVMFLDSDVIMRPEGWLTHLRRTLRHRNHHFGAVAPVLNCGGVWFAHRPAGHGTVPVNNLPGIKLVSGNAMDNIGFFHDYGGFGYEDVDLDSRLVHSGYGLGYDSEVVGEHPPIPLSDPRRDPELVHLFHIQEEKYRQGRDLYQEGVLVA